MLDLPDAYIFYLDPFTLRLEVDVAGILQFWASITLANCGWSTTTLGFVSGIAGYSLDCDSGNF
jgi:hypothetical protein